MKDERILAIIRLQEKVTEKYTLIRNHESVPIRLEKLRATIQEATERLDRARKAAEDNARLVRESKAEIETGEEKLNTFKAKLNQVKTTREYESRQKEITHQRSRLNELAEIIAQAEEKTADLELGVVEAQENQEETIAQFSSEIAELERESVRFEKELQKIEESEREAHKSVPPEMLERVDKLFRLRNGVGVVSINDGNCGGCGIQVSPQTIQLAKRGLDLIQCDRCSSYLYWDDNIE